MVTHSCKSRDSPEEKGTETPRQRARDVEDTEKQGFEGHQKGQRNKQLTIRRRRNVGKETQRMRDTEDSDRLTPARRPRDRNRQTPRHKDR